MNHIHDKMKGQLTKSAASQQEGRDSIVNQFHSYCLLAKSNHHTSHTNMTPSSIVEWLWVPNYAKETLQYNINYQITWVMVVMRNLVINNWESTLSLSF